LSEPDNPPIVEYAVFCGLDVGKAEHHACALNPAGKRLHDRPLPNDEAALTQVFTTLAEHGRAPWTFAAPAAPVARSTVPDGDGAR